MAVFFIHTTKILQKVTMQISYDFYTGKKNNTFYIILHLNCIHHLQRTEERIFIIAEIKLIKITG